MPAVSPNLLLFSVCLFRPRRLLVFVFLLLLLLLLRRRRRRRRPEIALHG